MNSTLSKKVPTLTRTHLTVIVVILVVWAILAGLFLPMLMRAMGLSRQPVGFHNLETIGQAIWAYRNDNRTRFQIETSSPSKKYILKVEGWEPDFDRKDDQHWLARVSIREDLRHRHPDMLPSIVGEIVLEDTIHFPTGFNMYAGWTESDAVLVESAGRVKFIYEVQDGVWTKRCVE